MNTCACGRPGRMRRWLRAHRSRTPETGIACDNCARIMTEGESPCTFVD